MEEKKTDSDVEGKAAVDPSVAEGINFYFGCRINVC